MPHKRAKRTTRHLRREEHGTDLPPSDTTSLAQESLPKSLTRVLQAESVRKIYKEKRMRNDNNDGERAAKRRRKDMGESSKIEIKHGESLAHFNRRVEDDMRVPVAEAMHTSRNHARKTKKAEAKVAVANGVPKRPAVSRVEEPSPKLVPGRKIEFDAKPLMKRLNDIVQAPPNFTKLPRGVAKTNGRVDAPSGKMGGVVSMAQQQLMIEERQKAILRYRELKETRNTSHQDS